MGRPSKCTEEFQRDAVDLVRSSGRPINQVARELGMSHEALRNWVRKRERQTGTPAEASGAGVASPRTRPGPATPRRSAPQRRRRTPHYSTAVAPARGRSGSARSSASAGPMVSTGVGPGPRWTGRSRSTTLDPELALSGGLAMNRWPQLTLTYRGAPDYSSMTIFVIGTVSCGVTVSIAPRTLKYDLLQCRSGPLQRGGLIRCRGQVGELSFGRRSCGA